MANNEQNELLKYIEEFNRSTRPRDPELKELKKEVLDSALALLQGREMVFTAFKAEHFQGLKNHKKEQDIKY